MPKTYYLGETANGAIVGRGSATDYGYTHAAVITGTSPGSLKHEPGKLIPTRFASFSRTEHGAMKSAHAFTKNGNSTAEIIPVKVVDAATFKAKTGKR